MVACLGLSLLCCAGGRSPQELALLGRVRSTRSKSGFQGVTERTGVARWQARSLGAGRRSLGYFVTPEDAALAVARALPPLGGELL